MPVLQTRRYEQILQRMVNRLVSRTELSDLTDSSALYHILSSTARELDDVHYQLTRLTAAFSIDTASGPDLDERARDIQPGLFTRLPPQRAVSQGIVFTRSENTGTTITIPAGTVVKTSNNLVALTLREATITGSSPEVIIGNGVGRDSAPVPAQMAAAGAAGNVGVGAVTGFGSRPPGIVSVTNTASFVNGADLETDDAFRERLKAYISTLSRCTPEAIEQLVRGAEDPTPGSSTTVRYSKIFEDPIDRGNVTLYVDDGLGTSAGSPTGVSGEIVTNNLLGPGGNTAFGGEEFLSLDNFPVVDGASLVLTRTRSSVATTLVRDRDYFINTANGRIFFPTPLLNGDSISADYQYYTGLLAEVQKIVDGDPSDRLNYPGARAAGVRVVVKSPTIRSLVVRAVVRLLPGQQEAAVLSACRTAVTDYINSLGISQDVVKNEIIERIMAVRGVLDVSLTSPTTNINILDDEIARVTQVEIE